MPFIDLLESSFQQMDVSCNSKARIRSLGSRSEVPFPFPDALDPKHWLSEYIPGRESGTCEWAEAVWLVDIPKLELRVGGGGHQVTAVQELDVAHSLPVALEHVQGLLRRPNKIILQLQTEER